MQCPLHCQTIRDEIDKVILEALRAKIDATVHEKLKSKHSVEQINMWLKKYYTPKIVPKEIVTIKVSVRFDMGWQKKVTGSNYKSNFGHAYLFGYGTGLVLGILVYSKKCNT